MGSQLSIVQSGSVVHLPVKTGVVPYKDHNNIPTPAEVEFKRTVRRPAVVYEQIHIGMPRSLLDGLKILAKSKRIGVTEIILDVFREYLYSYRYGLGQQQQKQQPPQPFNNQYYAVEGRFL